MQMKTMTTADLLLVKKIETDRGQYIETFYRNIILLN